ncbi:hypothetical protein [Arcobacter sp. CECT 9188]|uniref:hypothetical protein n=1 Tax=Arcobacter sp. CECT 9188 TaxID=2044505 RepID=UPI000DE84011|nr:hypothetical protein [Arcobacter sp. CECT 9188]RBQ27614.1 hypothetical protein CRU88_02810 [Arcobacter sp. CECT 9188]
MKELKEMTIEFNLNQLVNFYKDNLNLRLELSYNKDNKPVARLYKPTPKAKYSQEKQLFGFYFHSEDRRVDFLSDDYEKRFGNKQADENYKKDKKAKNEKEVLEVKVGDIFKDSWGYEQTNVDYYQVVAKPSNCFIVVKQISSEFTNDNTGCSMSAYVKPIPNEFINDTETKYKLNGKSIKTSSFSRAYKVENIETEKAYCSWYY